MIALPLLKSCLDAGLGLLYPNVCQVCDEEPATIADGFVGVHCWRNVRFIKSPFCNRCGLPYDGDITSTFECSNCLESKFHFRSARSAVSTNKLILDVIHRYKYQRALWFEPFLADLLQREAVPALLREKWDMLIPVPLHPAKEREREFNQAERLALCLSRVTKIPVNTKVLRRVESTRTQTLLSRKDRAENMRGAFAARPRVSLKGKRVILIDDVFTTGATTSACAKVLMSVGADDVCVWTVARGL